MKDRIITIIKSIFTIGLFRTINYLFQIFLVKRNTRNHILINDTVNIYPRKNTTDITVFRQVFLDGEYDFSIPGTDPKIIIDLGANVGMFTIHSKLKYPKAKIISLEPEPGNYKQLQLNTAGLENVVVLNKAIWKDDKGVSMVIDAQYGEWGATSESYSANAKNQLMVESITMQGLIDLYAINLIDILKIDIEGAEKYIFETETEWLEKVKVLIIELHDFMEKESSNNFFRAITKLKGFDFFISGENLVFINTRI